jgi:hypothetical protein
LRIDLVCNLRQNKQHGNTTLLGGWHLHRFGSSYRCSSLLRLHNRKEQTMTHSLYLSIIGAVVFFAAYIILRLLRDNERLILELEEAKAEARRRNNKANENIGQLNFQLEILRKKLTVYNKEAKGYEISLNAVNAEHRKIIQQLYGRIGAMQRQINKLKSLP